MGGTQRFKLCAIAGRCRSGAVIGYWCIAFLASSHFVGLFVWSNIQQCEDGCLVSVLVHHLVLFPFRAPSRAACIHWTRTISYSHQKYYLPCFLPGGWLLRPLCIPYSKGTATSWAARVLLSMLLYYSFRPWQERLLSARLSDPC